ncbi:PREDICTED: uncharacterized protein LOC107329471 [Acropora digitifera]|uniref:uncharacterized protein LOC107329471 n=1 Tax=Acropora digitifera TaxID=70779 RepID=UPI00077AD2A5|nr:PREDICTED: uncharacterized protein LOC107329471 [Acropora digitifera]
MGEALAFIKSIVKRAQDIEKNLKRDLAEMDELLENILEDAASTKDRLECIRRSLKLHRLFHLGEENQSEVCDLDRKDALDPGSIILEIVSDQENSPTTPRGSESHADKVLKRAKEMFVDLDRKNLFRPKVLAKVQRNGEWCVGSSIAVSNFLRPIYLRNRILTFKRKLLKAIINPRDDSVMDTEGLRWSSLAFDFKKCQRVLGEITECFEKPLCNNCRQVFRNLDGFISTNDNQYASRTFLGACAEYCPVNRLLPDEADTLSDQDTELIREKLTRNEEQCSNLFRRFEEILKACEDAYGKYIDSGNTETEHFEEIYQEIKPTLAIFGYLPKCRL